MPQALQHIGPIDTARTDANQQLALPRLGLGALAQAQHIGGAKGSDFYSAHTGILRTSI